MTLKATREELATALSTPTVPAYAYAPESFEPPGIVLQAAEPYLDTEGAAFGEYRLHLDAYLGVQLLDNGQAADDVDGLVEGFLTALPRDWGIEEVGQPGPITTGTWTAHAIRIRLSRFITL